MLRERECKIKTTIKIICPGCNALIELPMHKAVNGEEIICQLCQKKFKFGLATSTLAKKALGLSYAEVEELALSIYRQYVLQMPNSDTKSVTERVLKSFDLQKKSSNVDTKKEVEDLCQKDQ